MKLKRGEKLINCRPMVNGVKLKVNSGEKSNPPLGVGGAPFFRCNTKPRGKEEDAVAPFSNLSKICDKRIFQVDH